MFQMLSHGVVSGALFLCVGVVYDRMHTREIALYGGLVNSMPRYAVVFMLFMLATVGLPGTSGFVGEFLVLIGTFSNTWVRSSRPPALSSARLICCISIAGRIRRDHQGDDVNAMLDLNRARVGLCAADRACAVDGNLSVLVPQADAALGLQPHRGVDVAAKAAHLEHAPPKLATR